MLRPIHWFAIAAIVLIAMEHPSDAQAPGLLPDGHSELRPAPLARPGIDPLNRAPVADEPVVGIRVEGNTTILESAILRHIQTIPGRPATAQQVRDDVKALYDTRWFTIVEPVFRRTSRGLELTFRVVERPIVRNVEFRGNVKIKDKVLAKITGLKPGASFDISSNRESARRIESHYHEKGFAFAAVELVSGGRPGDRDVIFEIDEGPKVVVPKIRFVGNEFFSDALLKTKVRTKTQWFWLFGGKYDPATIPDDVAALKAYYESLGFFDVRVEHRLEFNEDRSKVTIEYQIEEGERYAIRNLIFNGNQVLSDDQLREKVGIEPGDFFNLRHLSKDLDRIRGEYGEQGRLFASVEPKRRFSETPGVVDLELSIDEDDVYWIRRINVHLQGENPHTKESVVLNRLLVRPGEAANRRLIQMSKRRLEGSQLFERGPEAGVRIDVAPVANQMAMPASVVRGQSGDNAIPPASNPIFEGNPQGDPFGSSLQEGAPDWLDVVPPRWTDIDVYATEARTGRLMFGVGVNSDAGVVGSIILDEMNFDILRPPTSIQDFTDGTAWRGGGQRFRAEAIPGNIVSRYLVSWTDPFFLDSEYSLGVSGFYYNRFFPDWDEDRLGGRVTLGKQITREISVSGSIRLESVDLTNPTTPTPTVLANSTGSNYLSTARIAVAHDTRDAQFLPAEGHFVELSYEQAFGDFTYPRLEATGNQYFTVYSRPDGGGRHILSLRGQVGWTDTETPVFERYYAGGFQTFRGFEFRGVTPRQLGVGIGGRWLALGGVEYMFPLTANEHVQAVAFSDFGTVEADVGLDEFRVTAGAGLRLTIPAMGPVPIALDWAVPLAREDADERRLFSFYVGLTR